MKMPQDENAPKKLKKIQKSPKMAGFRLFFGTNEYVYLGKIEKKCRLRLCKKSNFCSKWHFRGRNGPKIFENDTFWAYLGS